MNLKVLRTQWFIRARSEPHERLSRSCCQKKKVGVFTKRGKEGKGRSQNRDPGSPAFQRPRKKKSEVRRQGSQTQKKVMETPVCRVSGRERPAWPDAVGTTSETLGMLRRKDLMPLVREDRQSCLFLWVVVSQKLYWESQAPNA